MERIEVSINEDILDVIKKIRASSLEEVVLSIPQNSVLFENSLNLKLIKKEAGKIGKTINFETEDEVGKNLIDYLEDGKDSSKLDVETGFISKEKDLTEELRPKRKLSLRMPKISFNFSFGNKRLLILFLTLAAVIGISYYLVWILPKATVLLVVRSQPLVKSVTIKMAQEAASADLKLRLLPGKVAEITEMISSEADTTGEKIIGDKAAGKVTLYNKTYDDEKLKKGTTLSLAVDKETLKFLVNEDVTVPKQTSETAGITFGKKETTATSEAFGSKYNIKKGKTFKVSGFDDNEMTGKSDEDFTGGSSRSVKAVSQDDLTKLSAKTLATAKPAVVAKLKGGLGSDQKLIDSTAVYGVIAETFDKKAGDEAEKVSLSQSVKVSALYYSSGELQGLLDELLNEFVPEGFELSKKDSDIEVGLLSVPDGISLPKEVELMVKIRAYIVPRVDTKAISTKIKGQSLQDTKQILSEIKNIESSKVDIWPTYAYVFKRFPSNEEKIEITVKRE
ncbi:hypothetical protein HY419_00030 [candidate division WWE3 bacterium]|nr:hypothetical protein [candidate division WWE3 bacterium]